MCPGNLMLERANSHLIRLQRRFCSFRAAKTTSKWVKCSVQHRLKTKIIIKKDHYEIKYGRRTSFIKAMNVAGALVSPNPITVNSKCPNGVLIVVLGMPWSSTRTWLYPALRSSLLKYFAPRTGTASKRSSIDQFTYYCLGSTKGAQRGCQGVSTVKRRRSIWRRKALLLLPRRSTKHLKARQSLRGLVLY